MYLLPTGGNSRVNTDHRIDAHIHRWVTAARIGAQGRLNQRSRDASIEVTRFTVAADRDRPCGLGDLTGKLWGLLESTDEETRRDCVVEDGQENGAGRDGYREEAYV
jgi:hypothetical protein